MLTLIDWTSLWLFFIEQITSEIKRKWNEIKAVYTVRNWCKECQTALCK